MGDLESEADHASPTPVVPGELARLVEDAVAPYIDRTLAQRLALADTEAQGLYQQALQAAGQPFIDELTLREPMQDELERVSQAMRDALDYVHLDVDFPERPRAEVTPPSEDDLAVRLLSALPRPAGYVQAAPSALCAR